MHSDDLENLGPTARIHLTDKATTELIRLAYIRLLSCHPDFCGRITEEGQSLLNDLRDAIVEGTGEGQQEVQESCEEAAIKLYMAAERERAAFRARNGLPTPEAAKAEKIAKSLMDQYAIGNWEDYEFVRPTLKELAIEIEQVINQVD